MTEEYGIWPEKKEQKQKSERRKAFSIFLQSFGNFQWPKGRIRSFLEEIDQRLGIDKTLGYPNDVLNFKGHNHHAFLEDV